MSRIFGDPNTIKRVQEAKAGDPVVYVNLDAIAQLPEEYEATIVEVPFDKEKDFTNVGTDNNPSWYPTTSLMYKIADRRGISGYGDTQVEPIIEEVNISEMEMFDEPKVIKKKVGYIVKKQAAVLAEDGTMRPSGYRVAMYNAWDESVKLWITEEKWTEGYSKKGKYDNKYDTKWKRRAHFQDLLDKALGMADTLSWMKCIREIAGLKTSYTSDDLKEGRFYFAKIHRSSLAIKSESAARLVALSGGHAPAESAMKKLFGPGKELAIELADETEKVADKEPEQRVEEPKKPEVTTTQKKEQEKKETKRDTMLKVLEIYVEAKIIPPVMTQSIMNLIGWLKATPGAESSIKLWQKAISLLEALEKTIPPQGLENHDLY